MGKNEIIASLESQLKATAKENDACQEGYDKLQAEKDEFEKVTERQNNLIKSLKDTISQLDANMKFQSEGHAETIKQYQDKIQQLQEHKDTMILTVHISGGENIDEALHNAITMMSRRLEKLGLKDKYNILPVPHTIGVGIVR